MKTTISFLLAIAIATGSANAQYKKASFFTRNGKFYGVKTGVNIFGSGVSAAPVFSFVYGKDKAANHIWHWWDLEVVLGGNYKYTTNDANASNTQLITVSGKTNPMLNWRYNWCYYFGNNKDADVKGIPFAKLAVELAIFGRKANYSAEKIVPETSSPKMYTGLTGGAGADAGVGYVYKFTEKISLFGVAGYRIMMPADEGVFELTPNHPYFNIGIRFAKGGNDD